MASEIDTAVDDIITQIKDHSRDINSPAPQNIPDINNIEQFILEKTSALINSSVDMVEDVKDYISSAPEFFNKPTIAFAVPPVALTSSMIHTLESLPNLRSCGISNVAVPYSNSYE